MSKFRVGVLTGGGDTSALNATLSGIVNATEKRGGKVIGFRRGWAGVLKPDKDYFVEDKKGPPKRLGDITGEYVFLTEADINPQQGGTVILSSRTDLTKISGALDDAAQRLRQLEIDYFLPIGGDDTTTVTSQFLSLGLLPNVQFMAVPKTIDNDNGKIGPNGKFEGLEHMVNIWTPGFPTAVRNANVYSNFTYSTGYSHEKVLWNEAMGRKAGWLALAMGHLGLADMILIPEDPVNINDICRRILEIYQRKGFFYGVIAEGVMNEETGELLFEDRSITDTFGHAKLGGAAKVIAEAVKRYFKAHDVHAPYFNGQVPEYLYRGGPPTDLDRETAFALGHHALTTLVNSSNVNGHMAVLLWGNKEAKPSNIPLKEAVVISGKGKIVPRTVPIDPQNPENGFYDSRTKNITELGREYVEIFGISPIQFQPWKGPVYR